MQVTKKEIRNAFIEWDRQDRENPQEFTSCSEHYLNEAPETYGSDCADFFWSLLKMKTTRAD